VSHTAQNRCFGRRSGGRFARRAPLVFRVPAGIPRIGRHESATNFEECQMSATPAGMLSEERLDTDVQRAISGAEEMLQEAAAAGGDKAVELRSRALQQLRALRERLHSAQDVVVEKGKIAAHATDDYVHEHPWRVIVSAVGVGVLIGLLINRR
jgi:ElaB/YqjD/DUF883 family membrane-anchored ribosome-binding protein